jgi:asparagine synthase (glutamine-hydrolysing)
MLSGGLDSSAITCVARQLTPQDSDPLKTFSLVFDAVPECDERRFIQQVEDMERMETCHILADSFTPAMNLSRLTELEDQPFLAPGLFKTRELYKIVESKQVRVLLNGHGGDECVSHGFGRLAELAQEGKWITLAREIRATARMDNANALCLFWKYWTVFGWGKAEETFWLLKRGSQYWRGGLRRLRRIFSRTGTSRKESLIHPHFLEQISTCTSAETAAAARPLPQRRTERAVHYRDLSFSIQVHAFDILNQAAADLRVEPRYPFWDKRLVEFCLSLPADQKLRHGWNRFILRQAMAEALPDGVRWRTDKVDFTPYVAGALAKCDLGRLQKLLEADSGTLKPYLNFPVLAENVRTVKALGSHTTSPDVFNVFKAMYLYSWLESCHALSIASDN